MGSKKKKKLEKGKYTGLAGKKCAGPRRKGVLVIEIQKGSTRLGAC
jgi:hypothetical protein